MGAAKPAAIEKSLQRLRKAIEEYGVLFVHDTASLCATQLVAGEAVKGSWWGQPSGTLIYEVLNRLDNAEVAWPKLLGGKLTLVHRRLWPALIAAARSEAPWQIDGLRKDARALVARLRKGETLRSDELRLPRGSRKPGLIVSELESRLLVYCEQEHTDSGHHARVLLPYALWQRRVRIRDAELPRLDAALDGLAEAAARSLGESALSKLLPWEKAPGTRPRRRTGVRSRYRDP